MDQECVCMQDVGVCRVAKLQCAAFRKQVNKLCVCVCVQAAHKPGATAVTHHFSSWVIDVCWVY